MLVASLNIYVALRNK